MTSTIFLFDIDGTLVRGGPAKHAFVDAMRETFGTPGDFERVSFAGKTDPQIARELLVGEGLSDEAIDGGLQELFSRYLAYLEARLPENPVSVLPGVPDLLDVLAQIEDVGVGLLTGRTWIRTGAPNWMAFSIVRIQSLIFKSQILSPLSPSRFLIHLLA